MMVSIDTRRILMRVMRALLLSVALTGFMASQAQAAKPPAEAFFRNAALSQLRLSPDGRSVGMLVASENGRVQLGVIDLASMTPKVVAGYSDDDIGDYYWVNDDRLVFWMADRQIAASDQRLYSGLYAVNRDGTELRMLVDRTWNERTTGGSLIDRKILPADTELVKLDWSAQSDHVFVVRPAWNSIGEREALNLVRLNTRTGSTTSYDRPGNSIQWTTDHTGTPRITMTNEGARYAIHYRDPANDRWRKIAEFDRFSPDGFKPHSFGPDGTFYVLALKGRDTKALYRYDLVKNAIDPQPLVAAAGYDILPTLFTDFRRKKLAGIHFTTDAASSVWFDERMKEAQKTIDQMLPATINMLSFGSNSDMSTILVHAFSDVQPGRYLIYDAATKKLSLLGDENPAINPKDMAQRDMVRYKARDGLEIPAYLTLPQGAAKKNLPMVVLVHGGPWVRGSTWEWEADVQFLASRGYAVLQPEFRGSTGFGSHHFHAGWKQWGLAMQDDIADGAKWAIAQGIADPKRICIAGGSYGGYATLMGLARHPDIFRCGINMYGVTDITLRYDSTWSQDISTDSQRFSQPILVGDPVKDAEQLKATSPVNLADRIKQPLLMMYGGSDYRVPIKHGRLFRDAVKPHNQNVEWIEYLEEGHGLGLVKNRVDFWTRAEAFLEKHLGK
jgi:dipeptidyl aminopeptidase/acylaminoacyl peptidase